MKLKMLFVRGERYIKMADLEKLIYAKALNELEPKSRTKLLSLYNTIRRL